MGISNTDVQNWAPDVSLNLFSIFPLQWMVTLLLRNFFYTPHLIHQQILMAQNLNYTQNLATSHHLTTPVSQNHHYDSPELQKQPFNLSPIWSLFPSICFHHNSQIDPIKKSEKIK